MERKVGEVFDYEGHKLKVVESDGYCNILCSQEIRCFFDCNLICRKNNNKLGSCCTSHGHICFVEVTNEEKDMEKLDLTKILKPGMKVYSLLEGETTVISVQQQTDDYPIGTKRENKDAFYYTKEGHYLETYEGECVLFPSKTNRNWRAANVLKLLEPKRGDYLISNKNGCVFIYNGNCDYDSYGYIVAEDSSNATGLEFPKDAAYSSDARYATTEEIKRLDERLRHHGYVFNKQTLELKKFKWRGNLGDNYWYITTGGNIEWSKEEGVGTDDYRYEFGNYFKTREEAEVFVKQFRTVLNEYHNGRKVC